MDSSVAGENHNIVEADTLAVVMHEKIQLEVVQEYLKETKGWYSISGAAGHAIMLRDVLDRLKAKGFRNHCAYLVSLLS